jgi:hypothetical protein
MSYSCAAVCTCATLALRKTTACAAAIHALQRRAEAYIAVQHYGAAVADLQKLLEQASSGSSGSSGGSSGSKDVAGRLASAQAKQRAHGTLGPHHYTILGLEPGACTADVKAAYK